MVKPLDKLTTACSKVDNGVMFSLFDVICETSNLKFADDLFYEENINKHLPLASNKAQYTSYLNNRNIRLCNPDNFGLPETLLMLEIKRSNMCPWGDDDAIPIGILVEYTESTGPGNAQIDSSNQDTIWPVNTVLSGDYISGMINPGFPDYGSARFGSASVQIELEEHDPDNICNENVIRFTGTLGTLGLGTYGEQDELPQDEIQVVTRGCQNWIDGTAGAVVFAWVGSKYPIGPLGLVQALSIVIYNPLF